MCRPRLEGQRRPPVALNSHRSAALGLCTTFQLPTAMANDKKIIVDEDWKARVQAEKEEAAKSEAVASPPSGKSAAAHDPGDVAMPPASFELLVSSLATETLMALGAVPNPLSGKSESRPNQARYLIDTIDMLQQKTRGNLSTGEQQMIESVLHELRMLFVAVSQSQPSQTEATPPVDHLA